MMLYFHHFSFFVTLTVVHIKNESRLLLLTVFEIHRGTLEPFCH